MNQTSKTYSKKELKPATELMKTVAAKTNTGKTKMAKVFSPEEVDEILARRNAGESLEPAEHKAIREKYRKMKRYVKELELGNKSKLIALPSITNGEGFYKLFDFSALYYVYRLATRMGRSAKLMHDSDRFSKMLDVATLVNMEKFIEQFKRFEGSDKYVVTEDGIYIFDLKQPLTDDEVSQLRLAEETRRERLHNIVKPKAMNPAVFQGILTVMRQVAPRAKKLEKHYYYAFGEEMLKSLNSLLASYYDFANGILTKEEARVRFMMILDRLTSSLTLLSEARVWTYSAAAMIGESLNELSRLIEKDFRIKGMKK